MKTSTILLAVAGVVAAILLTKKTEASEGTYAASQYTPGSTTANAAIPPAIAQINTEAAKSQLTNKVVTKSLSQTVQTGVSSVVGGKTYTGNIAKLPTYNEKLFIGTAQPDRTGGLTTMDRQILKNKGMTVSTANARKLGLL